MISKFASPPSNGPGSEKGNFVATLIKDLAAGGNVDKLVDGMVAQLMTKERLYAPTKEIVGKFPGYLAKNKGKIPAEEYAQYEKQFDAFTRIVAAFDSNDDEKVKAVMKVGGVGVGLDRSTTPRHSSRIVEEPRIFFLLGGKSPNRYCCCSGCCCCCCYRHCCCCHLSPMLLFSC